MRLVSSRGNCTATSTAVLLSSIREAYQHREGVEVLAYPSELVVRMGKHTGGPWGQRTRLPG